jgi:hypothetical protein
MQNAPMRSEPVAGKVFCIGFYKTGTTTLFEALKLLGYRTINGDKPGSYPGADDGATLIRQIDAGDYRLPTFELFDAFTDNPYFRIWKEIYDQFPTAKYVLTVRDEQRWLQSCIRFYANRRIRPMRVWMFGPHADPSRSAASQRAWLEAYRAHNTAVREHFARAPAGRFLELDLVQRPGWHELCAFLARPIPGVPFPHANPTRPDHALRPAWRKLRRALGLETSAPQLDADDID